MDGKDLLEGFRYIDPTYIREAKKRLFSIGPQARRTEEGPACHCAFGAGALGLGAVVYLRCLRGS